MPMALPFPALVVLATAAAGLSAAITAGWIRWARQRNVVDLPGQRRLHAQPTPRGGGIGMAVVALLVAGTCTFAGEPGPWGAVFAGLACATATGMADDLLPMSSAFKLAGQVVAAAAIAHALPWPGVPLPAALALSFAWTLVLQNFWNFMDGANGMVALQSVVVAGALGLLLAAPAPAVLAWAVAAACVGFLPFNLPRARVFMGDTGSHVLGATIAVASLWALRRGDASLGQLALLLSAFGLDASLTLAKRMVQRRRFWRAHREHLYQLAVRKGHAHVRVCMAYAAWGILCAGFALSLQGRGADRGLVPAGTVWLFGAIAWGLLRRYWLRRDTRMDAPA